MKRIATLLIVSCLGLLFTASTCFAQMYTITDLGDLGAQYSAGAGINKLGQVVGAARVSGIDFHVHAFFYSDGTMRDLGTLGGTDSWATGINDAGEITGYSYLASNTTVHAFSYSNGTMTDLGTLLGGTNINSYSFGINASGQITGSFAGAATGAAFFYNNGIMTELEGTTNGRSINDSGQITGETYSPSNDTVGLTPVHAFLYGSGTFTDLGTLYGGCCSYGFGINASGEITGYATLAYDNTLGAYPTRAFLYSNGAMKDLGTLGGYASSGLGINKSGDVTGYSVLSDNSGSHAFLYSGGTMKDLNNSLPSGSGWKLIQGTAIADVGQITGLGINPSGAEHGFLLTPIIPYKAFVQQPINADGSSIFRANRGVVPVKFTLTENDVPTCALPPATISVTRTAGGTLGLTDESTYVANADSGSNFRIDPTACQYVYNLAAASLGVGTYRVDISINGIFVGHAVFALK
jgi:probable HAF family extracellular repeat protein